MVQGGLAGVMLIQVQLGTLPSEQQQRVEEGLRADDDRARRLLQNRGLTAAKALQQVPEPHCKLLSWTNGLKRCLYCIGT